MTTLEKNPIESATRLTGETGLSIHTQRAQNLCKGTWQFHEMGLFQFASVMQVVYQHRTKGDPYAHWHIDKTEKSLLDIKNTIQLAIVDYEQKIQQSRGLKILIFKSSNPRKLILRFSTPIAYLAADVIGELDYLLRQIYTFRHLGIFPESQKLHSPLYRQLKTILSKSRQWQYFGITIQDIREKNQKAQRAESVLGKLPPIYLK